KARTRMRRKDHLPFQRDFAKNPRQNADAFFIVDIRWTVQGDDDGQSIHADPLPKARGPSGWQSVKQAVDHDVADERYLVVRLSLGAKLFVGVPGRGQQQVSQAISDNPIDLLWHRSVEAAKTRLDVRDLDPALGRDDGGRHRGVDIAVDYDPIGPHVDENRFDALHDARRLRGLGV